MSSSLFDGYKLNEKEVLNRLDHWSKQLDEELNRPYIFREPARQAADAIRMLIKLLLEERELNDAPLD